MKLSFERSEGKAGFFGRKTVFNLSVRVRMSTEELFIIQKYELENHTLFEAPPGEPWNQIRVGQLENGCTLSFQRFDDLLEAEEVIPASCKNLKNYIKELAGGSKSTEIDI